LLKINQMNNQQAYNNWADTYDSVINKTRDIEAIALRKILPAVSFDNVLEIGCGTGKNTEWLLSKSKYLFCVDFSEEMLNRAKEKINATNVEFRQMDVRESWDFSEDQFDLITCSLILEHIENLDFVFQQANKVLKKNGFFYIGELHPFKQYQGSKARFETGNGILELECFVHPISQFFTIAKNNGFDCIEIQELFDDDDRTGIPRLLVMVFKKK
jgi:ubiquinone/menaquinone biosynthesis C-methylase UbiE